MPEPEPRERPSPEAGDEGRGSTPDNFEKFRREREAAQKALDKAGSGADFKRALKSLLDSQRKLTTADIDRRFPDDPEAAAKMKKFYSDFESDLKKALDKGGSFEGAYDSFLSGDTFKNIESRYKSDPKGKKAINDFKNSYLDSMRGDMKKLLPDLLKNISDKFEILDPTKLDTPDGRASLAKTLNDIDKFAEENAKDKQNEFLKNQLDSLLDRMNKGDLDPTDTSSKKANTGSTLKDIIKWLTLLTLIGGSIGLFTWWLFLYAMNHSGCQLMIAAKDKMPVSSKVICYNSGKSVNIFNPNGGNIEYSSTQCSCEPKSNTQTGNISCEEPNCSANEDIRPWNCNSANPVCNGAIGDDEYTIYFFGIMTPFDALGNMGNGIVNGVGSAASQWLNILLKFLTPVFIGIVILLVLWIIYKVVANRKPAETLKIETGSAPGTLSKFGNRAYLGNLSKYSNYAFMGRCVAQPARPYIPQRFKF